jgi:hypothetical protein
MYDDEDVPPFVVRPGEDPEAPYERARMSVRFQHQATPSSLQDLLKEKLELYGRDSTTSSYNGTPCKEWMGERNNGYGVAHVLYESDGVDQTYMKTTHRAAWSVYKNEGRELPRSVVVRHQCHNRACFNVDHLLTGTHKENMADRKRAGRDKLCGPKKKRELYELSRDEREQIRLDTDNVRYLSRKHNIDWKDVLVIKGRYKSPWDWSVIEPDIDNIWPEGEEPKPVVGRNYTPAPDEIDIP